LLRALSNLALNVARDGGSTTSLGNRFQCFTTLTVKNVFLLSSQKLPSLSLKPLLLVLSSLAEKVPPMFPVGPLQESNVSPNLLLSRLNNPNSLSLSLQERCSSPLINFVALLWTHSNNSISFLCWGLQGWTQYSRCCLTSAEQTGRINSLDLLKVEIG